MYIIAIKNFNRCQYKKHACMYNLRVMVYGGYKPIGT